ncbi:MAG: hypothetical protein IJY24_02825 [Clostridia bacterium]|nr:hypothetical protein [Clostridia bacterium]
MGKRAKYQRELPRRMYTFFVGYSGVGAPSFTKFGVSAGLTLEDIERFRRYDEFERAYRECSEIRRDYLIDNALAKKNDASLTKFLLSAEFGMGEEKPDEAASSLSVTLEVVDGP